MVEDTGDNMANRDQFSGDMSRNEVEIDLSKFMEMVTENNELKQKIFELEHDDKKNPWQKWIFLARAVDSWRIWPRAFAPMRLDVSLTSTFERSTSSH